MAVEEERVFFRVAGRARCGGVGAEVGLRKGNAKGRVGGKVELWVAFSPVFDDCDVYRGGSAGTVDFGHFDVCLVVLVARGEKGGNAAVKVERFWRGLVYMQGLSGMRTRECERRGPRGEKPDRRTINVWNNPDCAQERLHMTLKCVNSCVGMAFCYGTLSWYAAQPIIIDRLPQGPCATFLQPLPSPCLTYRNLIRH